MSLFGSRSWLLYYAPLKVGMAFLTYSPPNSRSVLQITDVETKNLQLWLNARHRLL